MAFELLPNAHGSSPREFVAFFPDNFEAIENPPLLVFLHGSAERGTNPGLVLKGLDTVFQDLQLPALVIFPQCDSHHRAFYGAMDIRVMQAINQVISEYAVDPSRVYLVGYSMGGSSNLWLAAKHPGVFAANVCIAPGITWLGAELPPGLLDEDKELFDTMFLAHDRPGAIARRIASLPSWFLQGTEDLACPIDETRAVVNGLRKLGCTPIETEYDGMGHDTLIMALQEEGLFEWLLSQKSNAVASDFGSGHVTGHGTEEGSHV